jgi:hypothetical protein
LIVVILGGVTIDENNFVKELGIVDGVVDGVVDNDVLCVDIVLVVVVMGVLFFVIQLRPSKGVSNCMSSTILSIFNFLVEDSPEFDSVFG